MGLDPGYMPFEMTDKKGNIVGFDVDLAKEMAKAMGVKLKIVNTDYDGIIPALMTDKIDIIGTIDRTGTIISFKPDDTVFTVTQYKYDILANRLRELAFLNAGIYLTLTDKRKKKEDGSFKSEVFHSNEGLKEFVRYIDKSKESMIHDVIHIVTEKQGIPVEVAMTYNTSYNESVFSYVNDINTIEGKTHLSGFRRSLTRKSISIY